MAKKVQKGKKAAPKKAAKPVKKANASKKQAKPVKSAKKSPAKAVKKAAPKKAVAGKKPATKSAPKKAAKKAAKPVKKAAKAAPKKAVKATAKKAVKPVKKAPVKAAKKATPAKAAKKQTKKAAPAKAVKKVAPVKKASPAKKQVKPVAKKAAPVKAKPVVSKAKPAAKAKPVSGNNKSKPETKPVVTPKAVAAPKKDSIKASQDRGTEVEKKSQTAPVKEAPSKAVAVSKPTIERNEKLKGEKEEMRKADKPSERAVEKQETSSKATKRDPNEKTRYSDAELLEFKELILKKLEEANRDYELLKDTLSHRDNNGTDDTSPTFKLLEDGSDVLSKEETAQLAARQQKFIQALENALIRIENKTYGICRSTGKLISKERLRSVPHATLSIEAKMEQS